MFTTCQQQNYLHKFLFTSRQYNWNISLISDPLEFAVKDINIKEKYIEDTFKMLN